MMDLIQLTRAQDDRRAVWLNPDYVATLEWTDGSMGEHTRIELCNGTVLRVVERPFDITHAAETLRDLVPA